MAARGVWEQQYVTTHRGEDKWREVMAFIYITKILDSIKERMTPLFQDICWILIFHMYIPFRMQHYAIFLSVLFFLQAWLLLQGPSGLVTNILQCTISLLTPHLNDTPSHLFLIEQTAHQYTHYLARPCATARPPSTSWLLSESTSLLYD